MNRLSSLALLAFGAVTLAGCNPDRDQADPAADADTTTAPAAPADVPPPTTTDPGTMPPPTDTYPPTDTAPPTTTDPTTDPNQEPPPPPGN
jgi:hypothetical protein